MDWKSIKKLMQRDGGKVFIVDDGAPPIVVLSFHEYERFANAAPHKRENMSVHDPEAFTAAFDAEYQRQRQTEIESRLAKNAEPSYSPSSEHIRLEDLPL